MGCASKAGSGIIIQISRARECILGAPYLKVPRIYGGTAALPKLTIK